MFLCWCVLLPLSYRLIGICAAVLARLGGG